MAPDMAAALAADGASPALTLDRSTPALAPDMAAQALVWPARTWSLSTLSEVQYSRWERDGFLVVPDAVNRELAAAAAAAIRAFIGANDSQPSSWYRNTLDIYRDRAPGGAMPHHGPCGMVQLFHHASLWAIRQLPLLHGIFSDIYGTRALYVTVDRAHFKPPQNDAFPAWSDPGDVHAGLHWDIDTRRQAWPIPFAVQGVVYLEVALPACCAGIVRPSSASDPT